MICTNYELKGRKAVQDYILREIKAIYSSQGQRLNDKHVELIIKQMFGRVYVEDAGETDLLPGEIVEKRSWQQPTSPPKKKARKRRLDANFFSAFPRSLSQLKAFYHPLHFKKPRAYSSMPRLPVRLIIWPALRRTLSSAAAFQRVPGLIRKVRQCLWLFS